MTQKTTHIRVPVDIKEELDEIASLEERDRIVVVTRMLRRAIAEAKANKSENAA